MNPISKYPNNQILIPQSPNNPYRPRFLKKFTYIIVFVILGLWQLSYSQDDYLEVKGDTRVDALTFTTFPGDISWTFPSTPVRGEVFYNFEASRKRPYYFDGTTPNIWEEFTGGTTVTGDKYVATQIVAASNSLDISRANWTCDGTDDQQEINRAINSLPAGGGAVYLLEGTYNISGSINFTTSNKSIIGAGAGTVLRVATGSGGVNVINASNVNRILISQLMVNGNNQTGSNNNGISFSGVTNSKIDRVWVENMSQNGIELQYSSNNTISRNNIKSNDGDGIYFASSNNNTISGNNIQLNSMMGIQFDSSFNNIISENNIQSNCCGGGGMGLVNSANNVVLGNNIQSNGWNGMHITGTSNNNVISGNNIQSNGYTGIRFWGVSSNVISANIIQSNGEEGVSVESSSRMLLSGNIVYDNGGTGSRDGIGIHNSSDNLISSNLLYDSDGTGYPINISTTTCNNNYLVGNLVSSWPAGYERINDSGTNTQYTDKVKMTLEKREVTSGFSPLDVSTNPRSYICLKPSGAITLTLSAGKSAGDLLILENISRKNITINDVAGDNINLSGAEPKSLILQQYDTLKLIWNGSRWLEMGYVDNN